MSMVPYNNRGELAKWDDWGRKRCDGASVIGLTMVGGSIFTKDSKLAKAGIALTIIPQFIKEIFFPRKGRERVLQILE